MTTTTTPRLTRAACEQLAREHAAALEADDSDCYDYAFDEALETQRIELLRVEAAVPVCVETKSKREN